MSDDQDLNSQDLKSDVADRAAGMTAGVMIAVFAIFAVVGLTMFYAGWFDNLTTADTAAPAVTQTAQPIPAPPAPASTVSQAPQNPSPANANR
jgi:hypothetical protein